MQMRYNIENYGLFVGWHDTLGNTSDLEADSHWFKPHQRLLEQETVPSLLSTGWFQEKFQAW